ncbi:carbonic anhydrase [Microthyrium microscopicum]|uniref:Carbonic anhydrase n=1 Tax=Microthyrium microscopicum TaxID=703497 RepID=A0A6A6TW03_9PEZI|nr:carbonic anhydrase [Microthyrium microscopicum]
MWASLISLVSLGGFAAATCIGNTHLERRSEGGEAFGYGFDNGPLRWHALSPANSICATGKHQSPIDVDSHIQNAPKALNIRLTDRLSGTFVNKGTTLQVTTAANSSQYIDLSGTRYNLKNVHFHTPSEHHLAGEHFPLEMHLVHQSANESLLVLGLLFNIVASAQQSGGLLKQLGDYAPRLTSEGVDITEKELDLGSLVKDLLPEDLGRYSGSLTTPPCSESVMWLVARKPRNIDVASYDKLKKTMKFNSRFAAGPPDSDNIVHMLANKL